MYRNQPLPRPRKPGTVTAVEVIMALKAGLLCTAVGALCLGLVFAVLDRHSSGIETWMMATLVVAAPFAAVYLAVATHIGKGRDWARITAIVLESLSLPGALFALVTGQEATILLVLGMAASIAVIGCATHRTAFLYCRTG